MGDIIESGSWRDPKSYLQELAQHAEGTTPVYRVLHEVGPDHDKVFTLGVFIGGKQMGTGKGHSKQEAQSAAAAEAVKRYEKK